MGKNGDKGTATRRKQAAPAPSARASETHATKRARASSSSEEEQTQTKATKSRRESSFSALEASSSCEEQQEEEEDPSEWEKEDERSSKRRRRDEPSAEQDVPALLAELIKNQQQTSRGQRRFALQQSTSTKVLIASMTAILERIAPSSAQKSPSVRETRYLFNVFVYINPLLFS
jgi:hypothetical protein